MIRSQKTKRNPSAFLKSTYDILQKPEYNHIIEWGEESGFLIKDQLKFQTEILPFYFKHQKYTSYVRQLNMYGFHKHRTVNNYISFKHDQFRRGHLELTQIKRKPEHKKKSAKNSHNDKKQSAENQMENSSQVQNSLNIQQGFESEKQQEQEHENPQQQYFDDNQCLVEDENCLKLCQLLLKQNKILVQKQQQFRQTIIRYKKLQIQHQKNSIQTLQKLCQLNQIQQQNNCFQSNVSKSSILSQSMRRLSQSQGQQLKFLSHFNRSLMQSIKQLNDTNHFMFSSTSIEGGYSNLRIEENKEIS